jgi:hypothetical protein
MLMIRYSQIENLPSTHPLVLAYEKQEKDLDDLYASVTNNGQEVTDDTQEYFDRYVAGDRK